MPSQYGFETESEKQQRVGAEQKTKADALAAKEAALAQSVKAGHDADPAIRNILRDYSAAKGVTADPKFSQRPPGWAVPMSWSVYGDSPVEVNLHTGNLDNPKPPKLTVVGSAENTDQDLLTLGRRLAEHTGIEVSVVREAGETSSGGVPSISQKGLGTFKKRQ